MGQKVKRVIVEPWQRGFKPRFSKEVFEVTKIYKNSKPIRYGISDNTKTKYYFNQLTPFLEDSDSDKFKKNLSIISHKKIPIKFLRSGRAIKHEKLYLTKIKGVDKPKYLSESAILKMDNGGVILDAYNGI